MLPAGPWGGQEQRNRREPHCFQQEKPGAVAVPAGEGNGWGAAAPQTPAGRARPRWSGGVAVAPSPCCSPGGWEQPCG